MVYAFCGSTSAMKTCSGTYHAGFYSASSA